MENKSQKSFLFVIFASFFLVGIVFGFFFLNGMWNEIVFLFITILLLLRFLFAVFRKIFLYVFLCVFLGFFCGIFRYFLYLDYGGFDFQFLGEYFSFMGERIDTVFRSVLPEPYSGFVEGLILGKKNGLGKDLLENFNATGLTHIIAVSGYNISILIVFCTKFFGFLGQRMKFFVMIFLIVLFVALTGFSASCIRAAIMGIVGYYAMFSGRQYMPFIGLIFAAFIMNLFLPTLIFDDIGFQLSFGATFGIVCFYPKMENSLKFVPDFLGFRSAFLMTISAQILTMPVILLNFGNFSVISPIANIFVLPLIPIAMFFGFVILFVGFFSLKLGMFFAFIEYAVLKFVLFLVELFANFPFAYYKIDWFTSEIFFIYYFVAIFFMLKRLIFRS
ncbi:MAG: ComEC/Rec2 family competence protein [Candidatus Peregrinibacteria bacterium]|nr:ComEC/Rec2 family competence protein [Candidatus Peregrinibacteria bacterium]